MRYFLGNSIFLLIFSLKISAQNCSCSVNSKLWITIDSLLEIGETEKSIGILQFNDLSKSFICDAIKYGCIAEAYIKLGKQDSSRKYLDRSEDYLKRADCIPNGLYKFNSQKAQFYFSQNDYENSLKYSLTALEIAIGENNVVMVADANLKVANIFAKMSQPERAKEYTIKARMAIERLPEINKKYFLYNTLANRYNNLFQDFKDKRYLDTIELFMSGVRSHAIQLGKTNRLLEQYYRKRAFLALKTKDLKNSLIYLDSALEIVRVLPIRAELYSINGDKANIYRKQRQFEIAKVYADSCLYYALKDNIVSSIINGYDIVYIVAKDSKDTDKALWAYENLTRISDSITSISNTGKIAELEQKYNRTQNEKTIKELNQESEIKSLRINILVIAIALSVALIFVIIFFYRQSTIKNKQKILEAEQRLNRSRINPHFFFNSLTTLQGLAVKENDGKKIALNLFKFSTIMRQTLESSYNEYVSIQSEIDFINKYIELQLIKDEGKFAVEIINEIDDSEIMIPTMLVQPFIENAIEHGFSNINYLGKIQLIFSFESNELKISITDNGKGIHTTKMPNKHISRAMQITTDRLYLLNKEKGSKASFTINSNSPTGIRVEILLPLLYK